MQAFGDKMSYMETLKSISKKKMAKSSKSSRPPSKDVLGVYHHMYENSMTAMASTRSAKQETSSKKVGGCGCTRKKKNVQV